MTPTTVTPPDCPHGLAQGSCEICRVLEADPPESAPGGRSSPVLARRAASRIALGVGAVAAMVALVVLWQVLAAVWALVHLLQLVAVGCVAGWIGWRLGVLHGRRSRS